MYVIVVRPTSKFKMDDGTPAGPGTSSSATQQNEAPCTSLTADPANQSLLFKVYNRPITWTKEMTLILCREVEFINPFQYKERTKERGQAWEEVAATLRKHGHVTKRSVRDKYKAVKEIITKRNNKEQTESGIAPELTSDELEMIQIIEDLAEVENDTKEQQNYEKEKLYVVDIRKRALETFTETSKRLKSEQDDKQRKWRNGESDASEFMLRKLEVEREMKEWEFELRRKEAELRRQDEERRQKREEREEERRREEEERRRKDDAERDRRMDLMQQQLLQQNKLIMMLLKNLQKDCSKEDTN